MALQFHSFKNYSFYVAYLYKANCFSNHCSEKETDDTSATEGNESVNILHICPCILVPWKRKFNADGLDTIKNIP